MCGLGLKFTIICYDNTRNPVLWMVVRHWLSYARQRVYLWEQYTDSGYGILCQGSWEAKVNTSMLKVTPSQPF